MLWGFCFPPPHVATHHPCPGTRAANSPSSSFPANAPWGFQKSCRVIILNKPSIGFFYTINTNLSNFCIFFDSWCHESVENDWGRKNGCIAEKWRERAWNWSPQVLCMPKASLGKLIRSERDCKEWKGQQLVAAGLGCWLEKGAACFMLQGLGLSPMAGVGHYGQGTADLLVVTLPLPPLLVFQRGVLFKYLSGLALLGFWDLMKLGFLDYTWQGRNSQWEKNTVKNWHQVTT